MNKNWWILRGILRNEAGEADGGGAGGVAVTAPIVETVTKTLEEQFAEMKAQLEATNKENKALKEHTDRLLGDTKGAQEKAKAAALEAKKLEEQKAREEGNWKQLLDNTTAEKAEVLNQYSSLQQRYANEKSMSQALQIAAKLIDPAYPQNAELLAESIVGRIRYDIEADSYKIMNARGEESLMNLADFSKEVDNNPKYASLLKSSQRSGGGAKGSGGGASKKNEKSQAEFRAMSLPDQAKFSKSGGIVTD